MSKSRTPIPEPFDLGLAEFYRSTPNMKKYRRLVELGAEIGDPLARYAMATWYLHGEPRIGIKRDLSRGVTLLESCASFFNRAAFDLAVSKLRGLGTRRDPQAAFSLFVRAASLGSLPAIEEQANCLATGTGTKRDPQAARFLLRRLSMWKQQLRAIAALSSASPHGGEPSRPAGARRAKRQRPTRAKRPGNSKPGDLRGRRQ